MVSKSSIADSEEKTDIIGLSPSEIDGHLQRAINTEGSLILREVESQSPTANTEYTPVSLLSLKDEETQKTISDLESTVIVLPQNTNLNSSQSILQNSAMYTIASTLSEKEVQNNTIDENDPLDIILLPKDDRFGTMPPQTMEIQTDPMVAQSKVSFDDDTTYETTPNTTKDCCDKAGQERRMNFDYLDNFLMPGTENFDTRILRDETQGKPNETMFYTLNNGHTIPVIALGTGLKYLDETKSVKFKADSAARIMKIGLESGFEHIVIDSVYRDEDEIGYVKDHMNMDRNSIFITAMLPNTAHEPDDVVLALEQTLTRLRTSYVNLYLMQSPMAMKPDGQYSDIDYLDTWRGMEIVVNMNMSHSIGVANFNLDQLIKLWGYAKIKPSVLSIEVNPTITQNRLISWCHLHKMVVMAFNPLGDIFDHKKLYRPLKDSHGILTYLAKKYKKSRVQILIRYLIDRSLLPVPASRSKKDIYKFIDVFDFSLTNKEVTVLSLFNCNNRIRTLQNMENHPYYPFINDNYCHPNKILDLLSSKISNTHDHLKNMRQQKKMYETQRQQKQFLEKQRRDRKLDEKMAQASINLRRLGKIKQDSLGLENLDLRRLDWINPQNMGGERLDQESLDRINEEQLGQETTIPGMLDETDEEKAITKTIDQIVLEWINKEKMNQGNSYAGRSDLINQGERNKEESQEKPGQKKIDHDKIDQENIDQEDINQKQSDRINKEKKRQEKIKLRKLNRIQQHMIVQEQEKIEQERIKQEPITQRNVERINQENKRNNKVNSRMFDQRNQKNIRQGKSENRKKNRMKFVRVEQKRKAQKIPGLRKLDRINQANIKTENPDIGRIHRINQENMKKVNPGIRRLNRINQEKLKNESGDPSSSDQTNHHTVGEETIDLNTLYSINEGKKNQRYIDLKKLFILNQRKSNQKNKFRRRLNRVNQKRMNQNYKDRYELEPISQENIYEENIDPSRLDQINHENVSHEDIDLKKLFWLNQEKLEQENLHLKRLRDRTNQKKMSRKNNQRKLMQKNEENMGYDIINLRKTGRKNKEQLFSYWTDPGRVRNDTDISYAYTERAVIIVTDDPQVLGSLRPTDINYHIHDDPDWRRKAWRLFV